jgi:hypothetical protein
MVLSLRGGHGVARQRRSGEIMNRRAFLTLAIPATAAACVGLGRGRLSSTEGTRVGAADVTAHPSVARGGAGSLRRTMERHRVIHRRMVERARERRRKREARARRRRRQARARRRRRGS